MRNPTSVIEVLIRQRVQALKRTLPAARRGDPAAVHRARVATRRLREALPLIESSGRRRRILRKVRRLTRALGPVRELDVALETLDTIAQAPRAALAYLKHGLRQERQQRHIVMSRAVEHIDLDRVQRRALAAARRSRAVDPAARAARRAIRLRSAIDGAGSLYLPDRLHDVRIALKKLRYALDLSRDVRGSRAVTPLRRLKAAQDLLGRMHDLEVLIARVRAVQGSPQAPTLSLSGDLDRLVRRLETDCRQLHGHYMAMRQALVAICVHVAAPVRRGRRQPQPRATRR